MISPLGTPLPWHPLQIFLYCLFMYSFSFSSLQAFSYGVIIFPTCSHAVQKKNGWGAWKAQALASLSSHSYSFWTLTWTTGFYQSFSIKCIVPHCYILGCWEHWFMFLQTRSLNESEDQIILFLAPEMIHSLSVCVSGLLIRHNNDTVHVPFC